MNFNSYEFIFLFLPVAVALFYLAPAQIRILVLIFISLLFYSFFGIVPFCIMALTILWGWISGAVLAQSTSRWPLIISLLGPFSILFLFKYLQFAFDLAGASATTRNLFAFFLVNTLPAGVSFHTFQVTAYMLDVRARRIKPELNFARFTAFLSFFPVLIAGPILHYTDIRDRLLDIQHQALARISVVRAFRYIAFGLFYKTVFADVLHGLKDKYIDGAGGLDAAFSILAYTMVIYYDFWGYSLMAMGIALLFGVELPLNFAQPYLSPNPKQFWRRWHITLSYWLRDYVYVNLGGNRNYVRNILIVFALCGLWHGAGTNFIVWGLYHAALVIGYHFTRHWWDRLPLPIAVTLTFVLVAIGWPLFYLDIASYGHLVVNLAIGHSSGLYGLHHWLFLAVVYLYTFAVDETKLLHHDGTRHPAAAGALHAAMLLSSLMLLSFRHMFIYVRF